MTVASGWVIYQPLIVGLGAVVVASLGNTLLEWFRQHLSHTRDARKVRRAFLEEITIIRRMFAGAMSEEQRDETTGRLLVPANRFEPVYDTMIGKIGVLEQDEISAILHAYSNIILTPKNLGVLGQYRNDEYSAWVDVSVKYAKVINNVHTTVVTACDEAIAVLKVRADK